jgi:hypothetical protein
MSMAVAGEINLNLNGLNSVINEEELTAMIMNNPEFIPAVKRELTNANNTYSA